jgi:hypothetical protein
MSESETWRVGPITSILVRLHPHSDLSTGNHKPASAVVLQQAYSLTRGFTHYRDEYLYQKLGLIRLPMLPQNFPWRKHEVLSESRMRLAAHFRFDERDLKTEHGPDNEARDERTGYR